MKILKKCLTWGTDFVASKMSSKYCCRKCERVAQRKREAEKRENTSADILSELETKQFLTPKDIAKLLDVGLTTVYRYFYSGMLKAVRIRRHTLVRRSDLEKFFDEAVPCKKTSYKKKADNDMDEIQFNEHQYARLFIVNPYDGLNEQTTDRIIQILKTNELST